MVKVKSLSAVCAAVAFACAFSTCACAPRIEWVQCDWTLAELGDDVSQHTEAQSGYLADSYDRISSYASGKAELSIPKPVVFEWNDVGARVYTLEISENESFESPLSYGAYSTTAEVYNLKTGTEYYWRVTAAFDGNSKSRSPVAEFKTSSIAPRNLYVEGVTNVRDIGGWTTSDGKRVKQGKIIRCGRLNKSETPDVEIEITEIGKYTMRDILGVRTEIDLRMPNAHNTETGGITSSPLGGDVNYVNIPMEWAMTGSYNYLTDPQYYPAIEQFFSIVADERNYPIIYHCNIGTDRTGLYAFLINGLLGVPENDLYRDYLFSNFGNIGSSRSVNNIKAYVDKAKSYEGETLSEKIENCLIDIGVEKSDIDAVKRIML